MAIPGSLKQRVRARGYVINGYCQMPGAFSAEIYARQGWDSVTLDLQHGLIGYDVAVSMLQAISATGVLPLVRVPWLDPAIIMKLLDAGALGITCPMINTAEDAERLVRYSRYPPAGERSFGPIRAAAVYGADYAKLANDTVNVFAMIETAQAVANIEAITGVSGLDGIYVGAIDLSMSMGIAPRPEEPDPRVAAAIERVLEQCKLRGLIAGIIARNPEQAAEFIRRGFQFITMLSDTQALATQAKAWVEGCRRAAPQRQP